MNSSSADFQLICVNDLLYYIDYKRKINAINDVVATCEAFYTPEAILSAKKNVFLTPRENMKESNFLHVAVLVPQSLISKIS